ncbi:MAG: hypothetical protein Kow0020_12880 [Wenzhouxiangellaceae bacterium]
MIRGCSVAGGKLAIIADLWDACLEEAPTDSGAGRMQWTPGQFKVRSGTLAGPWLCTNQHRPSGHAAPEAPAYPPRRQPPIGACLQRGHTGGNAAGALWDNPQLDIRPWRSSA